MIYEKLAILTDSKETSLKVIALFAPYMAVDKHVLLCNDIILLDTNNGIDDWTEIVKADLDIDVKVIPIKELVFDDKAPSDLVTGLEDFIKMVDISYDINYFLDIANQKGGVELLSPKEYQRLIELGGGKL